LEGSTEGIVSGNSEHVPTVMAWLPGTDVAEAMAALAEAEREFERAKRSSQMPKRIWLRPCVPDSLAVKVVRIISARRMDRKERRRYEHGEVQQSELPPLTEERKAELKALAEKPDSEIDYSDIPPLDEAFWARAVPNPFFKPVKTHASVRIDSDVLAWLKSQGKGYQTRMNAILREAMLRSLQHKA